MEYITKSRKFKLKLTEAQKYEASKWISVSCLVYNTALRVKVWAWQSARKSLSCYDLQKQVTELRHEYNFIAELPSDVLQSTIERLDNAYNKFFKSGAGFPKHKKRKFFTSILFKRVARVSETTFKLPKLGVVKIHKDNLPADVELRTASLIEQHGDYYLSIQYREAYKPLPPANASVGIDMGLKYFCADSNGNKVENPRYFVEMQKKLRIAQRSLSRKKKGSANYRDALQKVAKIHEKIKRQREHFQHQISNSYINANDLIVVENLQISNLLKNKHLAKHVSDAAWYSFRQKLEYKSKWHGRKVAAIAPHYSSQECNKCGHIDAANRVTQSLFCCTSCGHTENADVNAGKVLLSRHEKNLQKVAKNVCKNKKS